MKDFRKAQERFTQMEGANFGGCLEEVKTTHALIETRIRKGDGKLCMIRYSGGEQAGFDIYAIQN